MVFASVVKPDPGPSASRNLFAEADPDPKITSGPDLAPDIKLL